MDLTCYKLGDYAVPIVPANADRPAMDRNRHAYRCLPLSTANAAGYFALCPSGFTATWDGDDLASSLVITPDAPAPDFFATSHFAYGILTFNIGWLFRTAPGVHLWAMGPPNVFKGRIQPYAAVVETDWLPYTFTMNWQMTEPGSVRFEAGEPFCFITPTQLQALSTMQPRTCAIADAPDLQQELAHWTKHRAAFNQLIADKDPQALKQAWQKFYFRGEYPPEISKSVDGHIHKLRLAPLDDLAGSGCPIAHHPWTSQLQPQPQPATPRPPAAPAPNGAVRRSGVTLQARSNLGTAVPTVAKIDGEGRLRRSRRTRTISTAAEARDAGVDFLFVDDVLSPRQNRALCDAYAAGSDLLDQTLSDPFWRDRLIHYRDIGRQSAPIADLMRNAMLEGSRQVSQFWKLQAPIYADTLHLAGWREGMAMAPHVDNAYPDGEPHPLAHRAFSGVFYLNDAYEGGGLYLPKRDLVLQPRVGAFVSLPADADHEHAVLRVESGVRFTMPFFLTFDETRASRDLHPQLATPDRPLSKASAET